MHGRDGSRLGNGIEHVTGCIPVTTTGGRDHGFVEAVELLQQARPQVMGEAIEVDEQGRRPGAGGLVHQGLGNLPHLPHPSRGQRRRQGQLGPGLADGA